MAGIAGEGQATRPMYLPPRPQPRQMNQPGMQQPDAPQQPARQQPNVEQQPGVIQPQVITTAPGQPVTQPPIATRPADAAPTTPPSPPAVVYRDGLLSVQAVNSSLNSVLTAIRNKTGIEFEGWENSPDRVALSLGPAPAGEVLAGIFSGSKFDFVAIGRPDNPAIVQRVIMSPKSRGGAAAAGQPQPQQNAGQESDEEEVPDEQVNINNEPQDTPVQPPPQPPTEAQNPQPKTPEQLAEELKQLQENKNQQGQGTPNPAHVPRKTPP